MRSSLRGVALLLLFTVSPLALDGCVSVGLERSPLEPAKKETGALEVSIFATSADRDTRHLASTPVFSQLFRVEKGQEKPVARSMATHWGLSELSPGTYRLRVTKKIDERGDIQDLPSGGNKTLVVRTGEKSSVDVLLRKVPVFWIAAAALTVVALAILSIDALKDAKIPVPKGLPPLPPIEAVVAFDFSFGRTTHDAPALSPGVVDVFPASGSIVAARRVTVTFLLAVPLAPQGVGSGALQALGSLSGEIGGTVSYLPNEQLLRFAPQRDFTPGETVTVTVDLERLTSLEGSRGEGKVSTSFVVPDR